LGRSGIRKKKRWGIYLECKHLFDVLVRNRTSGRKRRGVSGMKRFGECSVRN